MKNLLNDLFGKGKTKNVEVAQNELQKADELVAIIEGKQAEMQDRISKINSAMNIVEATLLIDPKDKNALATKDKGDKQLASLNEELAGSQEELSEAQTKRFEAQKNLNKSAGEKAVAHSIQESSKLTAIHVLSNTLHELDRTWITTEETQDVSQAYGFGDVRQLDSRSPEFAFILEQGEKSSLEANEKGRAIAQEALQAMVNVLVENGIEFSANGINAFEHAGVTLKNK
ncbi:hypothetical protein [Bacillus cereus]|uniref:hypothetical protein n=1 Tax=Bacillus cereus TaxID=1396 RepID=UPI0025A0B935|nr:hypothetical protein [Bacillus cereus]MDM5459991.1 hypothetical protein [Bacillus cereus]